MQQFLHKDDKSPIFDYNKVDRPHEFRTFKDRGSVSYPKFVTSGHKTQYERVESRAKKNQEATFLEAFD